MTEKPVIVVMTASGRVREHPGTTSFQRILESIYEEYQQGGSQWDRPTKLFVGGRCIVKSGLADIAWDYGKFLRARLDEVNSATTDWIEQRLGGQPSSEAA